MSAKVEAIITQRIIDALEAGTVPWQKPWFGANMQPRNAVTKIPYRGVNILMCNCGGFSNPNYITLKQLLNQGLRVKRDEFKKSTPIVFWTMLDVDDKDNPGTIKRIPVMRFYQVWNVEQLESIPEKYLVRPDQASANDIDALCEQVIENYTDAPKIREEIQDRAYYRGGDADEIVINPIDQFKSSNSFYCTLFHELAHSTSHQKRMNRNLKSYSYEELVAEISATMLASECKIDTTNLFNQNAAYIASWLKSFRDDKKMIIKSAQIAQKVVDYILKRQRNSKGDIIDSDHQAAA